MKKNCFIMLITFIALFTASCHKNVTPPKPKVDPLSLISATISQPVTVQVDYTQSISTVANGASLKEDWQASYTQVSGGVVTLNCVTVQFNRVIPVDTIKLWMTYKNLKPATSQVLANYGAYVYDIEDILPRQSDSLKVVGIGDSGTLPSGSATYLEFGDSMHDYSWDLSDVSTSELAVQGVGVFYLATQ